MYMYKIYYADFVNWNSNRELNGPRNGTPTKNVNGQESTCHLTIGGAKDFGSDLYPYESPSSQFERIWWARHQRVPHRPSGSPPGPTALPATAQTASHVPMFFKYIKKKNLEKEKRGDTREQWSRERSVHRNLCLVREYKAYC